MLIAVLHMRHFIIAQMGMEMTRCKPCLRLGSLVTDSETETTGRRCIGKLSQERRNGRCGRTRSWRACSDTADSGHPIGTRHWDGPQSWGNSQGLAPNQSLRAANCGPEPGGMGVAVCEAVLVTEGDSQRGPHSEPQWQIVPETDRSTAWLWRGNMGGATHWRPQAPTPCSALC